MDRKMFNIRDHNLHHLYKMIVGVTVQAMDGLPQMVCWECTSKLLSLKKFKEQAQTSQLLLLDKLAVNNILTVGDIKSIDRINYNLKSSLTMKHYKYNIEVFDSSCHTHMEMDIKSERDQGPTLEIDGSSPTCKIPKCAKVEPESNNLVKLLMLDLKQDIDVMDTSQPYISDELHSDISQHVEHNYSKPVNTKPTRQWVKKVVPAAQRTRPKRDLNVQTNGDSAARVPQVEPESNNLVKLMMLDLKQNIDAMDTSQPYISDELHSDISQQAEHSDSNVNTKPTRQRVKKVVPAAQRKRSKRNLNVQKKGNSAAKVGQFSKMELPCFEIRDLTPEEQQAAMAARARSAAYLTAPYKCDLCYKAFLSERTLARHAVRHTETFGAYGCALCKHRFRWKRQMRNHIKTTHASEYTCRDCGMVTQHRSAAITHQREHNGTNIFQCSHCPVTFRKKTSLLGHLRIKHSSRFACELCGYTFLNQHGVNTHKRKSHILDVQEELTGPYCEECKLRFASDEAYQRHLTQSSVHSSDDDPNRVYNELYATYKVQPRKTVKRRLRARQPIPCEECGEQQVNYRAYGKHFRAAHPGLNRTKFPSANGNCMCEQCGGMFAVSPSRTAPATGNCMCEQCGGMFAVSPSRTAPATGNCMCEQCGGMFAVSPSRTAPATGNCMCEQCGGMFAVSPSRTAPATGNCMCEQCGGMFAVSPSRTAPATGNCMCEQCGRMFAVSPSRTAPATGNCMCEQCGGMFAVSPSRTAPATGNCMCEQCGGMFAVSPSRTAPATGNCMCEQCGGMFAVSPSRTAPATGNCMCEQCGGMFAVSPSRTAPATGNCMCEQCGGMFAVSPSRTAPATGNCMCEQCGGMFAVSPSRTAPATGNCMCEQCGGMFACVALLRDHMVRHGGESRHRCDVCDKAFTYKFLLDKHRLKHGSQPLPTYPCPQCERTFSSPASRAVHVKTLHERSIRFECEICSKEFTAKWNMRDHIDHVHHKKPWPKRVRAPRSRTRPSTDRE
ncbi:zinc finger protein 729-like isoform X2 [Aricia agestis]|nr:zinc finger protein 729-like isoform X2 [Aricia agestis]